MNLSFVLCSSSDERASRQQLPADCRPLQAKTTRKYARVDEPRHNRKVVVNRRPFSQGFYTAFLHPHHTREHHCTWTAGDIGRTANKRRLIASGHGLKEMTTLKQSRLTHTCSLSLIYSRPDTHPPIDKPCQTSCTVILVIHTNPNHSSR